MSSDFLLASQKHFKVHSFFKKQEFLLILGGTSIDPLYFLLACKEKVE